MLLSFTKRGRLPLGKIGERLQVHPTSVTNVIDRLESTGLVERIPHPDDARTTLAAITHKGRNVATKATAVLNANVFEPMGTRRPPTRDGGQRTHVPSAQRRLHLTCRLATSYPLARASAGARQPATTRGQSAAVINLMEPRLRREASPSARPTNIDPIVASR